ncbi:MAG: T9SS type A sorting domain-containing protein [Chryseolinea sp.]
MKQPLPTCFPTRKAVRAIFSILILAQFSCLDVIARGSATIDLEISALTLTAVDETNFIYSFSLTNSGSTPVSGYSMKLTFSSDQTLNPSDYFQLIVPSSDLGGQYIGANQTLFKNEHFFATTPKDYVLSGTWYVFAEINYDKVIDEADYVNNLTVSSNTITVAPYQLSFTTQPDVVNVTDSSFTIKSSLEQRISFFYYLYQPDGDPAPDVNRMKLADQLYPWQPQAVITGLGPAYSFDVYMMGESYDGNITSIIKVDVTTLGTPIPTIHLNKASITFDPAAISQSSGEEFFFVSGFHLTSDVVITPGANFLVSKDGVAYASQISYLVSDFGATSSHPVFVKSNPIAQVGLTTSDVTCTSTGATSKKLNIAITVFDPLLGSFDNIGTLDQSGWSTYNVSGQNLWSLVDLDKTSVNQRNQAANMAVQIDGADGGATSNEDWLISPALNVSAFTYYPNVHYRSYSSGDGESLSLIYSSSYQGSGDPRTATWFNADGEFAAVNSEKWVQSSVQIVNNANKIYFAFVYTSTLLKASKWTIDDWKVTDNLTNIPKDILSFEDVEVGTTSGSATMFVELAGYGDVSVEVSGDFKISTDNISFGKTAIITAADALNGKALFIVFAPKSLENQVKGTVTFTGNDLSVSRTNLVGSSMLTTAAERNVSVTGFIYPNPTDGIVHVDMNSFDNPGSSLPVKVANSIGATVADFEVSVTSLDTKLSDIVTGLAPGIYYVTVKTAAGTYRNKVFRK